MNKTYKIPAIQGESALQTAISLMLRRYLESERNFAHEDPALVPGLMALRFAWWLFDHAEELEATAVQVEVERTKEGGPADHSLP
jgi:ammonia channel protein AmtB